MDSLASLGLDEPFDGAPARLSPRPLSPAQRDHSPSWLSSSRWSLQGSSYSEQFASGLGAPGQELSRLAEGPSLYINGPPNVGNKSTLERGVYLSPRGRIAVGTKHGPAKNTEIVANRRMACKKSAVGPDPYGVHSNNLWKKPGTVFRGGFAPESGGGRQPWVLGRTAGLAFDPHLVRSRNEWRQTSQSIKSITSPTGHGSPLLPTQSQRPNASAYSRMRSSAIRSETAPPRHFGSMYSPMSMSVFTRDSLGGRWT